MYVRWVGSSGSGHRYSGTEWRGCLHQHIARQQHKVTEDTPTHVLSSHSLDVHYVSLLPHVDHTAHRPPAYSYHRLSTRLTGLHLVSPIHVVIVTERWFTSMLRFCSRFPLTLIWCYKFATYFTEDVKRIIRPVCSQCTTGRLTAAGLCLDPLDWEACNAPQKKKRRRRHEKQFLFAKT